MSKYDKIMLPMLTASIALMTSALHVNAQPVFEVTVKKVISDDGQTKLEAASAESVQVKKQVTVSRKKQPKRLAAQETIPGVDNIITGSVTAEGSPEFEQANFIKRIAVTREERLPIDVRTVFDVFDADPVLNVHPVLSQNSVVRGEPYVVRGVWNYSTFIDRAEVRVFEKDKSIDGKPLTIIAVDEYREALIHTDDNDAEELVYVLRVYDENGRFDETKPRGISITKSGSNIGFDQNAPDPILVLEDVEDFTANRQIKVEGGAVIIRGSNIYQDEEISVLGTKIRISEDGEFEAQEILAHGTHNIPIEIAGPRAKLVERTMVIPDSDWFYVGQLDLTAGQGISDLRTEYSNDLDWLGHAGFYVKGKLKGGYGVTASVDTEESELKYLASNVIRRQDSGLLNRVDPSLLFPVYGDNSTITDDAPSETNLYARFERGDDHVVVGSYSVQVQDSKLINLDRGLFGAKGQYRSDELTSRGDVKTEAVAYAAALDTVPNYETFIGTGGTIFRLSRQDIVEGSLRLNIQVLNKITNTEIGSVSLQEGKDYAIDHLTGRIILAQALARSVQNSGVITSSNDVVVLSARYEFQPITSDVDGYTVAGRSSHYLGDNVRVGVTAKSENDDIQRNTVYGGDILIRMGDNSSITAEIARSDGPDRSLISSVDGGVSFVNQNAVSNSVVADAYRVETSIDLFEQHSLEDGVKRRLNAYYEHFDEGFAGLSRFTTNETDRWGGSINVDDNGNLSYHVNYDETQVADEGHKRLVEAKVSKRLNEYWVAKIGAAYDWVGEGSQFSAIGLPATVDRFGGRLDVLARLDHKLDENRNVYAFGQATAQRTGNRRRNDRVGVGAELQINEDNKIGTEVSYGTSGVNAGVDYTHKKDNDAEITVGYAYFDDTRFQPEVGGISADQSHVFKTRGSRKLSETTTVFSESLTGINNKLKMEDTTNVFGLEHRPNEAWRYTALIDSGIVDSSTSDQFKRNSVSVGIDYADEKLKIATALETRFDRGAGKDADFYAGRIGGSYKYNEDWEVRALIDTTYSRGNNNSLADSEYVKASLGGAYRPVNNDRLNGLFKYEYLSDLSPSSQFGSSGTNALPKQRSHIGEIDANYDISDRLSIGAKYAIRTGEVSLSRDSNEFIKSIAQLAVIRGDYQFNKKWSVLMEARRLDVKDVDHEYGLLAGLWYNINDNTKLGAGYSFSDFSSDVADLSEDNGGFFVNMSAVF